MPDRQPFEVRGLPYIVSVPDGTVPTIFGPFPDYAAVERFLARHRFLAYSSDCVFPPEDAEHLKRP